MTDITDITALRESMQAKLQRKRQIIETLKTSNETIEKLRRDLIALPAPPRGSERPRSPARLAEAVDKMEFQIATSAYTPAQERDMIRTLDGMQAELAAAKKEAHASGEGAALRGKLEVSRDERRKLVGELQTLRKDIDAIYQQLKAADEKRAEEMNERRERRTFGEEKRKAREEEEAELEPYMKEVDPFVSLEEIAEIKRKPGEAEETATREEADAAGKKE